ncbi:MULTISPECIES: helix-turn-helix transcriptional regulator [Thalassobaculum]|uniref:Transcriptional regulator, contains XRE-family HTH domain n=1 Tax=Thalassobaculum litoreum DSM 18839 TaxID=1123362 RepID=A0A8G2BHB0_9PROT|nr:MULTISPECIES: helix-turn-helix transcriptional regulator [Thalassobaculum]SDF41761.1 Transcriptional regulator, contains XRE-family HTH domain [Thalassobaculum litoreum DSM 18839]
MNFGPVLRRIRAVRRLKQQAVADLVGVTQATVSRWENGDLAPSGDQRRRLLRLLHSSATLGSDHGLRRLVETSPLRVHLVCDITHRLLAASPAREAEWHSDARTWEGRSLYRFATEEIRAAEARLDDCGWFEGRVPGAYFWTGASEPGTAISIQQGYCLWERLTLNDGSPVRMATTLGPDAVSASVLNSFVDLRGPASPV